MTVLTSQLTVSVRTVRSKLECNKCNNVVSSANKRIFNKVQQVRSLIYSKKSRAKNRPLGVPKDKVKGELVDPSMLTNCLRLERLCRNQSSSTPLTPIFYNLCNRISWLTVSNAVRKSQKIALVCYFELMAPQRWFINVPGDGWSNGSSEIWIKIHVWKM